MPEGILPGQAINIIVPKETEQEVVALANGSGPAVFDSVEGVRDAAVLQAKGNTMAKLFKECSSITFLKNVPLHLMM